MQTIDKYFLPLSALAHFVFCPRRCALVHNEQQWEENYYTTCGSKLHSVVDKGEKETRCGLKIARSVSLVSNNFQIFGIADVIEFYQDDESGVQISGWRGKWRPYPIEYKNGGTKNIKPYEVQLCAQALCLEEMLNINILTGALFYGTNRHRVEIQFDKELRQLTEQIIFDTHKLIEGGKTPKPNYTKACNSCSLKELCQPQLLSNHSSANKWINKQIDIALG